MNTYGVKMSITGEGWIDVEVEIDGETYGALYVTDGRGDYTIDTESDGCRNLPSEYDVWPEVPAPLCAEATAVRAGIMQDEEETAKEDEEAAKESEEEMAKENEEAAKDVVPIKGT